jgi:hypothetical protein
VVVSPPGPVVNADNSWWRITSNAAPADQPQPSVIAYVDAQRPRQLRRANLLDFCRNLPPCLVAMEACATAHFWAREIET